MRKYQPTKGIYHPHFPEKYIGKSLPIFRSGWEAKAFQNLDKNPKVIKWGSECYIIPYRDMTRNNETHRYIIDLYFEILDNNNKINQWLIEIKPFNQSTINNNMKSHLSPNKLAAREAVVLRNQCKWHSAIQFAKSKGMHFGVWTEKGIEQLC